MKNYKIRVNNEAESKEAQELFFELGYSWYGCGKYYNRIGRYTFITAYQDEMLLRMGWGGDTDKEITLHQLRDMVVLKRNDINDANCIDKKREAWYLASDGTYYAWQYRKLCWDTESDACVEAHDIKKITQSQDPALISGAEAKLAWANGVDIQIKNVNCVNWYDLDESKYNLDIFDHVRVDFRIKPQTIKLELELPKPFEPKVGEIYWYLTILEPKGYDWTEFRSSEDCRFYCQLGAWRTEEEIKQVVEQLRKIKGAV